MKQTEKVIKTVYFAHSKLSYGTRREAEEFLFLKKHFERIINPNTDLGELGDIKPYLVVASLCDAVVVSAFIDDFVGKGCFDEVETVLRSNKPVFQLIDRKKMVKVTNVELFDLDDWKVKYGKLITQEKK
ncbi:MAG: hypothetical protein WC346_05460 [Methanogenium sp.]|jgi:hypothetical protein